MPSQQKSNLKIELINALNSLLKDPIIKEEQSARLSMIIEELKLKKVHIPGNDYEKVIVYIFMITTFMPGIVESKNSNMLKTLFETCWKHHDTQLPEHKLSQAEKKRKRIK